MSIISSFVLFTIFIIAYMIIIEIFTVLFRLTGLTHEKAKTQVISMLTNSGFTTNESEIVLSSKRRRRLAQITMLFGYSFTVIIVSIIVNIFLALNQSELRHLLSSILSMLFILTILIFFMRLKKVKSFLDKIIEKLGNRLMFGKASNTIVLIDNYKNKAMVEIHLESIPDFLKGVRLADAQLKKFHDIQILFIKRNETSLDHIDGDTILHKKDIIFLFGNYKNILHIFEHSESSEQKTLEI